MLQVSLSTYADIGTDSNTRLVVNQISLPKNKTPLSFDSISTIVTMEGDQSVCPFNGRGRGNAGLSAQTKLTELRSSGAIYIDSSLPAYASFTVIKAIENSVGSARCDFSLRIDTKPEKKYKLAVNGQECTVELYEDSKNSDEYILSDDIAIGGYRDAKLCI